MQIKGQTIRKKTKKYKKTKKTKINKEKVKSCRNSYKRHSLLFLTLIVLHLVVGQYG
jgi:hypothetical protein